MKTKLKILSCLALIAMQFACKEDKPAIPEPEFGTMTDIEGNVYKTVKIGDQEWMAENLRVEKFNDGSSIPIVELESTWSNPQLFDPMMCYYNNDKANKQLYGGLYNWYAIHTGKLAPKGWHIPNDTDWQKLQDYLIAHGYNYDASKTGNKIAKSLASTNYWKEDDTEGAVGHNQNGNNKTGFTGLPSGKRREDGIFSGMGSKTGWWSSTTPVTDYGYLWSFFYDVVHIERHVNYKRSGYAVRCVKDKIN